ncbi:Uncharacterised protein [Mycobacterium tuberculosis]|nr:Uncharacterised protein [Mycobacterium tuberculosis]
MAEPTTNSAGRSSPQRKITGVLFGPVRQAVAPAVVGSATGARRYSPSR